MPAHAAGYHGEHRFPRHTLAVPYSHKCDFVEAQLRLRLIGVNVIFLS